jgi:signal transduction histidine kinase
MPSPLRALIVEDSEADCALVVRALSRSGYDVQHTRVDTAEALQAALQAEKWDVVISDYSLPGFNGSIALAMVREKDPDVPFIYVSGTIGESVAVDAMRTGAQDYIIKGNLARLAPAIQRELREAAARREHKNVERRMRQLEKYEAIGQLAGGIAHDFNNVIGAVMGWAELGGEEVPEGSRAAKYFQNILSQSERAAGLTRQLLAYARRQILEPRNINLNEIIGETAALLQKTIGEQIEVKTVLAPDLQCTLADPSQIEQVLMNLCFNARDAMPEGGELRIETRNVEIDEIYCRHHAYARAGPYVLLAVSDTGTGIDAATLERIFEPFFTTKGLAKGTGLGLATVLGTVKQHEGFIEVYTELGKGTSFKVYLPMSGGVAERQTQTATLPVRGGTETILVAEDHPGIRDMAREILEALGYRLLLTSDGEEAVREFAAHHAQVSLLLLDVVMPKLSGPDAYEKIGAIKPGVPVIFTSGYSEQGDRLSAFVAGGAGFLQKPYGAKILAQKVREILDHSAKLSPA